MINMKVLSMWTVFLLTVNVLCSYNKIYEYTLGITLEESKIYKVKYTRTEWWVFNPSPYLSWQRELNRVPVQLLYTFQYLPLFIKSHMFVFIQLSCVSDL